MRKLCGLLAVAWFVPLMACASDEPATGTQISIEAVFEDFEDLESGEPTFMRTEIEVVEDGSSGSVVYSSSGGDIGEFRWIEEDLWFRYGSSAGDLADSWWYVFGDTDDTRRADPTPIDADVDDLLVQLATLEGGDDRTVDMPPLLLLLSLSGPYGEYDEEFTGPDDRYEGSADVDGTLVEFSGSGRYTAQADDGLEATIDIAVRPAGGVTISRPSGARNVHEWYGSREDGEVWLAGP